MRCHIYPKLIKCFKWHAKKGPHDGGFTIDSLNTGVENLVEFISGCLEMAILWVLL